MGRHLHLHFRVMAIMRAPSVAVQLAILIAYGIKSIHMVATLEDNVGTPVLEVRCINVVIGTILR